MKHLRQYIRGIILEGLRFGQFDNLALFEGMWGNDKLYFLFNIEFIQELTQMANDGKEIHGVEIGRNSKHLYGMVSTAPPGSTGNDCEDAAIVNFAAAKDGWGPTTYDIVMGLHPKGIIADRDSVTDEAFNVWSFYKDKRPDIEKKPLDHTDYEWTETYTDDCEPGSNSSYLPSQFKITQEDFLEDPLSWSYNRGPVPNMEQLRANWDITLALADENGLEQVKSEGFWEDLARGLFDKTSY